MITHIRTTGFKGFDIDEDVHKKVIYTGPNTSGKSARAGAIALTLYGNIPFATSGKRPSDIIDSFGDKEIITAITIDGMEFARKIYRTEKGVSQSFQVNKKRCSAPSFTGMLGAKGNPKIADISAFMDQSESKKVDTLFDLYPVEGLETIDQEIERAKAEVSHITKKIDGTESTIQRLTTSKQNLELPPGSIAEIQAEISNIDQQIADLQDQIKAAEIEEEKEQARIDAESGLKTEDDWKKSGIDQIESSPEMKEADRLITGMENQMQGVFVNPDQTINGFLVYDAAKSIQRIIDALIDSGCSTCAALIVAKQELKKAWRVMKVIGLSKRNYICEVNHSELEKFMNLYYNKLEKLKEGDEIDLGKGYDYSIKTAEALRKTKEFIESHTDIIRAITDGLLIVNSEVSEND